MSIKLFRNKDNAFENNIFRLKTNLENFWDLELQSYQYEPTSLFDILWKWNAYFSEYKRVKFINAKSCCTAD